MKPLATSQAKRAAEDPHGFFLDLRREGRQEPRGCSQEADGQEEKGEGPWGDVESKITDRGLPQLMF